MRRRRQRIAAPALLPALVMGAALWFLIAYAILHAAGVWK